MSTNILNTPVLPFCKGCGHDLIAKNTAKALEKWGRSPLDVIMVTDIGCHGIIDKALNTHTVHGLHGRSAALAAGISFALSGSDKKIIVFIGDGGATIGLQHIIEASRMNLNITIIIHNNMLYGMTGGQTSGLTPAGFNTTTATGGNTFSAHDICALTHTAGASLSMRIMGIGDYSDRIYEGLLTDGCSVIEVVEICPSYGVKLNPGRKLSEIMEGTGHREGAWYNERKGYIPASMQSTRDLISNLDIVMPRYVTDTKTPCSVVITGSAGEGVQLAASILSRAAMLSGLHVTQKGSYPVTVGVGFSTAEVNISPYEILFNGMQSPDAVLVSSADGLNHNLKRIKQMDKGMLLIDASLQVPETKARVYKEDFRITGARNAAIASLLRFSALTGTVHRDAIYGAVQDLGLENKLSLKKIEDKLDEVKGL